MEKSIHHRDTEHTEFGIFFNNDSLLCVLRASAVNFPSVHTEYASSIGIFGTIGTNELYFCGGSTSLTNLKMGVTS
jgi:hypothetical protein